MPLLRAPSSIVVKYHYTGLRFCQEIFMPLNRAFHYSGSHYIGLPTVCVSVRQAGDGDQDDVGKDDEEGGDDGGDGKFEYVASNERGSSQVSVA